MALLGYAGKILRVNLTEGNISPEPLDENILQNFLGGAALGIKTIYDEVPPGVEWFSPQNHICLASGPLGGTRISGSGSIAVATKGAMTQGMTSTQANGFFGAFLRFAGFDGLIIEGEAPRWSYLYIHDGMAEFKNADHLLGKDTFETDHLIKEELGKKEREMSVLCIGPAGENRVRFACMVADCGHVASHNGVGAVMGSKKLKAIAIQRGQNIIPLKDKEALSRLSKEFLSRILAHPMNSGTYRDGTVGGVVMSTKGGVLPVKNYTTGIYAIDPKKLEAYTSQNIRSVFKAKPNPCWACSAKHCHMMEAPEGNYNGRLVEEPEYEGMATFSSAVGIDDMTTTVILANEADRLGIDVNECAWLFGWVMECYEKRLLTQKDTDGLEMVWGNGEAIMAMLKKVANREGFGDILAEGVMRASQQVGGEAKKLAIYTQKGNTPRSHDHRVLRFEQFDTSVSNLGTIEAHSMAPFKILGMAEAYDPFDPEVLPVTNAKVKGAMVFEDSMVTCRFQTGANIDLLCQAVTASTGWEMDIPKAMTVGKRAVNLARVFNLRHGIDPKLDAPSMRYGSTPLDGAAAGRGALPQWDKMLRNYYKAMGWDENTGKPLPETLRSLGLEYVVSHL